MLTCFAVRVMQTCLFYVRTYLLCVRQKLTDRKSYVDNQDAWQGQRPLRQLQASTILEVISV